MVVAVEDDGARSFEIEATDEHGIGIMLRFVGGEVGGGVYSNDKGNAILVPEEGGAYSVWSQTERETQPEQFADAVWATVTSLMGRRYEAQEIVANVLAEFGIRPVIDL